MSNEEQVEYDTLYNKGFEEGITELEQPEDEDSNTEEEVIEDEVTEGEEETPEQEEQSTEEPEEQSEDLYELDYKGEKIKASKEELIQLAQKGFDYTSKTQDLASKRNILELIGDKSPEEVKTMIDAINGDKEALSYMAKQAGIDIYDINEDTQYQPKVEQKNYALDDAINSIKADATNAPIMDRWIDNMPSNIHQEFKNDPKLLTDLHMETKNGVAQNVMPEVIKMMAMGYNGTFKDAYLSVRQNVVSPKPSKQEVPRETIKKATVPKKNVSKHTQDVKDIWNDDELYAKMQKMRRGY